ncbi:hypothetical protein [Burkholderia ambifaria]|uniref:hypothetical protein n=1 Tax=Burkholderia ambifaria TaxID=152480 RepID=UPI001FC8223F|nr:hypothetical protein [Burkholderia ambifaria]WDR89796.1 hypothetical protein OR986_12810 [Burkholderia ambifaria]WDS02615.1 hypothetical protein OR985_17785 [Burkholderia ambifaria]
MTTAPPGFISSRSRRSAPYRSPFEHRKPALQLETAVVVGPKGEEIYTDELNGQFREAGRTRAFI